MKKLVLSLIVILLINCKKESNINKEDNILIDPTKINYLCLSNNLPTFNHQFGIRIDNDVYCSAFREYNPRINKGGELEIYYYFYNSSQKCCSGIINMQTIGFKKNGKSSFKIIQLESPDANFLYKNTSKLQNAKINIITNTNNQISGEFDGEIVTDGKLIKLYGNFKDLPLDPQ